MGHKCLPCWEVHTHNSFTGFFVTNPVIRFLPSFLQRVQTINHHLLISIETSYHVMPFSSLVDRTDVLLDIQPAVLHTPRTLWLVPANCTQKPVNLVEFIPLQSTGLRALPKKQ